MRKLNPVEGEGRGGEMRGGKEIEGEAGGGEGEHSK